MNSENLNYDYVVVGSGAAGGVVFDELKKKNLNVLLIEKGNHIKSENIKNEFYYSLRDLWKSSGYQYANGNISLPILQGSSLGGSTTINGSIMQEIDHKFCEKISNETNDFNKNFKFENLIKYQEEIKNDFNIKANDNDFLKNDNFKNVIEKKNWTFKHLMRATPNKFSRDKFLSGGSIEKIILRKYKGSNIRTNTEVKLIIKDRYKILGIECYDQIKKEKFYIKINKKLIISCGVIESAKLLMRSKIKNKNIGKKFSCHLSGAVDALFLDDKKEIECNFSAIEVTTDDKLCQKFANQNVPKEIILSRMPFLNFKNPFDKISKISSWVFNVSSTDTGYLHSNYFDYHLNFNLTKSEFDNVKKFIYKISEFLFDLGAVNVFPNILNNENFTRNLEEVEELLKNIQISELLLTASHLFGTCCIAKNDDSGVINENFQVFNHDNLFVVDSSIFPFPTSYNPQLTIMIFAKIASNIITNDE